MACKVEYYEENNYLVRKFQGTFCSTEIISSWKHVFEKKIPNKNYIGVLNDFRKATLDMDLKDLDEILNLFKENKDIISKLKIAVIMVSPDNIIFPIIAERNTQFNIKAFSTYEAAKNWMLDS